jgi:hypothetical protein
LGGNKYSEVRECRDNIVEMLTQNVLLKDALPPIIALGYRGNRTVFEGYCRKLIAQVKIE